MTPLRLSLDGKAQQSEVPAIGRCWPGNNTKLHVEDGIFPFPQGERLNLT